MKALRISDGMVFDAECSVACTRVGQRADDLVFVSYVRDVTQENDTRKALIMAAEAVENAGDAIVITDELARIISVNQAFTRITGYSKDEVLGKNPRLLKSGKHDDEYYSKMYESLRDTGRFGGEIVNRRKDGSEFTSQCVITEQRDGHGNLKTRVSVFSDATFRAKQRDETIAKAQRDPLTGAYNGAYAMDYLRGKIEQSHKRKTRVSVLFVDLDHFKEANDKHGHACGDHILKEAVARMTSCTRDRDIVARKGGDEFVLVLLDIDRADAHAVADKVVRVLAEPFTFENKAIAISGSVGVVSVDGTHATADELIRAADHAMYEAKTGGKGRFFVADLHSAMPVSVSHSRQ